MNKKSKTRLFVDKKLSLNIMIYIKDKQFHYIKNVIRCKVDDEVMLLDNETGEWNSKIISLNRDNVVFRILSKNRETTSEKDIWLIFASIKQHRLNITIQKATELGIKKFIPCITNYSDNNFLNYRNLNLNIIEAAEQCERMTLPALEKQIKLDELLFNFPKDRALIFCNERDKSKESMFSVIAKEKENYDKWALLIGPEGGFSEEETNNIKRLSNSISVTLGKRILRSDTAATAALFCIQSIIEN